MPKNIILLSDGTGNSAGKANKTNVWRLYRALNLRDEDQVAYYDDGVGSQQFLPIKILGGAFGIGLRRNVIQLYEFLCRNYEDRDKIYLFGFSRGAFTVRTVVGLIHHQGLVSDFTDEADLHKKAKEQYRKFRTHFPRGWNRKTRRDARSSGPADGAPEIAFIGCWDTVDAYGVPIDELARLWDLLIYPLRFPDQKLSSLVQKACHALALDDERQTFHPVLWNESPEATQDGQQQEIEQVWFAGAHANVGGGYPKDELALVTLNWMISHAETRPDNPGLHFISSERQLICDQANVNGTLYDSRRGLSAYYRCKPRKVYDICHDAANGVTIDKPKVHESVFERIRNKVVPYAPIGIPAAYSIVGSATGSGSQAAPKSYEDDQASEDRVEALNGAWSIVLWRRWLYLAFLLTTAALVSSRFVLDWTPGVPCQGVGCYVYPVFSVASVLLPDFVYDWLDALQQNPLIFFAFVAAFVLLYVLKSRAWSATQTKASAAWTHVKSKASGSTQSP